MLRYGASEVGNIMSRNKIHVTYSGARLNEINLCVSLNKNKFYLESLNEAATFNWVIYKYKGNLLNGVRAES